MPSTSDRQLDIGAGPDREAAGVEPCGEATAAPPEILERLPDEMRKKLPDELVDELLAGARTEEEIVGPGGLLSQLTKRLVERATEVEVTDHLGYEPPPGTARWCREHSQRRDAEDACDRAWAGWDQYAQGSPGDV